MDSVRGFGPRPGVPGPVCEHLLEVAPELGMRRTRNSALTGPCSSPFIFDNTLISLCFFWRKKWRFLRDRDLPAMIPRRYPRFGDIEEGGRSVTLPVGTSARVGREKSAPITGGNRRTIRRRNRRTNRRTPISCSLLLWFGKVGGFAGFFEE